MEQAVGVEKQAATATGKLFRPRCGTTFDENFVLPWTRGDFTGVLEQWNKSIPALRDRGRSASPVSQGGDFRRRTLVFRQMITRRVLWAGAASSE
jgi:hypothetical protein